MGSETKPCLSSSQLGGWPVSGNWTPLDFNQTLSLLMSQYGHFPFFRAYLRPLPIPPHTPVIQVREALAKMQGTWEGTGEGGLPQILGSPLLEEGFRLGRWDRCAMKEETEFGGNN